MLDTKYNPKLVEAEKYNLWKEKGYFKSGDLSKKPFSIVIPPPNVTGKLHLGHAWDTALQDIIIRYKRMNGYDALWLPGMDHAGIATQAKVDAKLKAEGIKPREMDREQWLKHAWAWKDEYSKNIRSQWSKLGLSLDYNKERFTLDDGLSEAVKHVFITLYEKGLIYRGERIINWDPEALTALSNEEVIYKDVKGAFYHLKYFIDGTNEYLDVATTRPETLFGDTAVAVNPKDERYNHLIGKKALLPMTDRLIEIIGDEHADPEFGTGIVKITPAHDPNDFEVGERHNLEKIKCINPDGTMNENAGIYNGLDRFLCRKKLIEDLKEKDLLISIEEINHSVGHSERTDCMIEPYLSKQWFVSMKELALQVLEAQKNDDTKVHFVPKRFEKILIHWMENCHDWCISRQLWWGHRIPAWYKGEEIYVGKSAPEGDGWIQENDVLDTWFSSNLWPFSTLGWPEETEDYKRYFPNDVLVTGYDIIFFWVARMIFTSLEFTKLRPFKECLIHGLVRDKNGRKMSKSLGNGVDPMDVIDKYGADSLRYFLTTSSAPGMDLRYDEEKVKSTWNFLNKLWNASRYTLLAVEGETEDNIPLANHDKWILTRLNKTIKDVRKYMDKYEFHNAGSILNSFIWNDFCDSYIEMSKFTSNTESTKSTLLYTLRAILKMLHPFAPYITEEIYSMLPNKDAESIMISNYPKPDSALIYKEEAIIIETQIEFIKQFRTISGENNIPKTAKVRINNNSDYKLIIDMLRLSNRLITQEENITNYLINYGEYSMTIYYEKEETEEEKQLREKQILELESSIKRREKLLSNENYINKAPKNIVEEDRKKLQEEKNKLEILKKK